MRLLDRTVASDNIIELAAASLSHAFSSGEMRDMFLSLNGLDTLLSLIYSQNARVRYFCANYVHFFVLKMRFL